MHALGHVQEQVHGEDGILVTGRYPASQAGMLDRFVVSRPGPAKKLRA